MITKTTDHFLQIISAYATALGVLHGNKNISDFINEDFGKIHASFLELGAKEFHESEENGWINSNETYLMNYSLPEYFKDLAFLHRDTLLRLQIARFKAMDALVTEEKIEQHSLKSKLILKEAIEEFLEKVSLEKKELFKLQQSKKIPTAKIQHQQNPWPIYAVQLEKVGSQIKDIQTALEPIIALHAKFKVTKDTCRQVGENNAALNTYLIAHVAEILTLLKASDFNALSSKIDDALDNLDKLGNNQERFTEELDRVMNQLQPISFPVTSEEGYLKVRFLPTNKRVQKWFDYEILPQFMDVLGQEEAARAKFQISLSNLSSGVKLQKNNELAADSGPLVSTIHALLEELKNLQTQGASISENIIGETESKLLISNLFKNEPFLEVSLNDTISSTLDIGRNTLVDKWQVNYRHLLSYFNTKYKDSAYHESFSEIEITTRCIAYRMLKEENEHYDTLFLTKNFIGDLFLVPREQQEKKFIEALSQWKNGFPKAILVSGDRLSGRSTFSNYVAKKYFGHEIVALLPNSTATIDGRKFSTSFDLHEALNYVDKYNGKSTKPIILIDDLELWCDAKHDLLNNIRSLITFIENGSDDALVLTVCSNAMKSHLDKRINFSNVFSTLIDTSIAGKNEILEGILLRHGAGHRTLISENGDPVSQLKIKSIASKLGKNYEYNIGEVLQAWTYRTYIQEGQKVLFKEEDREFLDFFSNEELIIIKQATLFKTISEYGLKRLNPDGFEPQMKSGLKRLINTKILVRDFDGKLSINPVALYDIGRILEQKKYIKA